MEYLAIADLKKNPNNPRIIKDDGFNKLKESLQSSKGKEHFDARPCIVSTRIGENIIIAGNTRFQAAKELGWKEVPVVIMDGLTQDQENEIIIRDNVSNGEWNWEQLANEWDAEKLNEWGLDVPEIEHIDPEVTEDDYEIPDTVKTDIVLGDLIEIGEHRLLCGDSTQIDQVEKVMNGENADMVFTDPPYGMFLDTDYSQIKGSEKSIGFKGNKVGNKYDKMIGDNEDFTPELINTIFASFPKCKEIFIWGADYFIDLLPNYGKDGSWLVWNKRSSDAQQRGIGNCFELCWSITKHKRFVLDFEWFGFLSKDDPKEARNRVHPSMKPSKLIARMVSEFCKDAQIIADLYLGSGSTMVASHQLKRKCYGMELDPKYCQVIVDRMKKLDTSLIIKRNGELWMN